MSRLSEFCDWLSTTTVSQAFQDRGWFVPAVQTVHILAISFLVVALGTLSFRLIVRGASPDCDAVKRLARVFWLSLSILLATGALLTITEPARELLSWVFSIKMLLVIVLAAVVGWLQTAVRRRPGGFDLWARHAATARLLGVIILILGLAIMTAGRWIAYV